MSTPLPTGEWGRPPRPEAGDRPDQRRGTRLQLRRFFPPPPPPPPVTGSSAPPLTRRRFRSIAAELTVAASVIALVSLFAVGSPPKAHRSTAQLQWNSRALPALTFLVGDLTTLQSDTTGQSDAPGNSNVDVERSALAADTSRLRRDIAAARSLPAVPSVYLAADWSKTLSQLDAVTAASDHLQAANRRSADYQSALTGLEAALSQAGQSLLRMATALR